MTELLRFQHAYDDSYDHAYDNNLQGIPVLLSSRKHCIQRPTLLRTMQAPNPVISSPPYSVLQTSRRDPNSAPIGRVQICIKIPPEQQASEPPGTPKEIEICEYRVEQVLCSSFLNGRYSRALPLSLSLSRLLVPFNILTLVKPKKTQGPDALLCRILVFNNNIYSYCVPYITLVPHVILVRPRTHSQSYEVKRKDPPLSNPITRTLSTPIVRRG